MRTFALILVALTLVPLVLLGWAGAARQAAQSRARNDAAVRIQHITASLRESAADGTLTDEEIRWAGAHDDGTRENGRLVVSAIAGGNAQWWSPMLYGSASAEKSARWLVDGTRVEIIETCC